MTDAERYRFANQYTPIEFIAGIQEPESLFHKVTNIGITGAVEQTKKFLLITGYFLCPTWLIAIMTDQNLMTGRGGNFIPSQKPL